MLTTIINILLIIVLIWMIIFYYFIFRNEWVSKILDNTFRKGGLSEFNKFPDYNTILFKKFWVWNKDKLKRKDKGE